MLASYFSVMDAASAEQLRAMPYLRDLAANEVASLVENAVVRSYAPRQLVLTAGEPAPGFFFVLSGKARIYRIGRDGREQTLRIAGPHDTFGEVPVFDDGPAPAWVEALQELEVILVPSADFHRLIEHRPQVALILLRQFARRIRVLTEQVEQMSLQTVQARVCRYLFQLAQEEGRPHDEGIVVPRQLTQQDLATVVGSVREVVGRTMKALERDGIIRVERQRLVILDMELLGRSL